MIYTTLNELRGLHSSGFARLLSYLGKTQPDDDPLPLVTVLDSNDLDDAILCLRVCPDVAAEFARWCADRADTKVTDTAADTAAYWAADAAHWAAHWAAAGVANRVAYWAADAAHWAADAAGGAEWAAESQAQADKLRELLS